MMPSQREAARKAQSAGEARQTEIARGRERMGKVLDDFADDAQKAKADPERAAKFDRDFNEK